MDSSTVELNREMGRKMSEKRKERLEVGYRIV